MVGIALVGMAGFEPAASTSQMWRDTGLRYIPKWFAKVIFKTAVANYFSKRTLLRRYYKNTHYQLTNIIASFVASIQVLVS